MRNGIVAASHPLAAEAGASTLRAGGNAIDAAAAVQLALNVVEPLASGIGGGALSLIVLARGHVMAFDCRERAPRLSTPNQFLGPTGEPREDPFAPAVRGLTVGVPGTVLGIAELLRRFGSLPLDTLAAPAVELAESGSEVSALLAQRLTQNASRLSTDPASAAIFFPGGQPLAEGDRLVQPDLARTLRLLGQQGPEAFYRGLLARAIVEAVSAYGGRMTMEDLAGYSVVERRPLHGRYREHEILSMPPPGSGVTLLQMLALLEHLEVGASELFSPVRMHLELQAMRLALADRAAYLGDPDVVEVPLAGLMAPDYLATRRALLSGSPLASAPSAGTINSKNAQLPNTASWPDDGDTTHFVVADRWGNLVCWTGTIENFFGSAITVPDYGFLLNNELTDFDALPGGPNTVRPGARPVSSMTPTLLIRDGRPWVALGSPGGPTIVTTILQVLLRVLDDRLSLQEAIAQPRYFASRFPRVTWEPDVPQASLDALWQLGHLPASSPTTIGSVQLVRYDALRDEYEGAADPRRLGTAISVRVA